MSRALDGFVKIGCVAAWTALCLLCGCGDLASPSSKEPEPVPTVRESIRAANDLADALARVQDLTSARVGGSDIETKLKTFNEAKARLKEASVKYKDAKLSQSLADELKQSVAQSQTRLTAEIARVERLRRSAPAEWKCIPKLTGGSSNGAAAAAAATEASVAPATPANTSVSSSQPTTGMAATGSANATAASRAASPGVPAVPAGPPRVPGGMVPERLDPNDPQYYEKLADRMLDSNPIIRREALDALLRVEPDEVKSAAAREKIAQNFKHLALERRGGPERGRCIEGLTRWSGKSAVPVLLEILNEPHSFVQDDVYKALGDLHDERAVGPVAARLNNFFERDRAASCLKRIGPLAEDAVLTVASARDPKTMLMITEILGEIGTKKSFSLLRNLSVQSRNADVRAAAKLSIKSIQARQKEARADDRGDK